MTNFEYIKNHYQTPDAMVKLLLKTSCEHCVHYSGGTFGCTTDPTLYVCAEGIKQWLESEAEE